VTIEIDERAALLARFGEPSLSEETRRRVRGRELVEARSSPRGEGPEFLLGQAINAQDFLSLASLAAMSSQVDRVRQSSRASFAAYRRRKIDRSI
jgi:hypothetical protein